MLARQSGSYPPQRQVPAASAGPLGYARALRRRWPIVVLFTILGLAAGYVTSKPAPSRTAFATAAAQPSSYQATAILMPLTAAGTSSNGVDPSGLTIDAMAFFATTGQVPRMVATQLGFHGNPSVLASEVQVKANDKVGALEIAATRPTGPQAVTLVDAFSTQLIAYLNDQIQATHAGAVSSASTTLAALEAQVKALQAQPSTALSKAKIAAALSQYRSEYSAYEQLLGAPTKTTLTVIQSPVAVPASGSAPTSTTVKHSKIPSGRKARTAIGGAVGLLVGLALALVLDRMDTKIYDRDQVEEALGLPVLAVVRAGKGRYLVALDAPTSPGAEEYRLLGSSLAALAERTDHTSNGNGALNRYRAQGQVIVMAPVVHLKESSAVVANLAACVSDAGNSVIAVAPGERDTTLEDLLGTDSSGEQVAVATGADSAPDEAARPTAVEGVRIVRCDGNGSSRGAHVMHAKEVVAASRVLADVVLVATPAVLTTHDAGQLAAGANAVVLVCRTGKVKVADARLAVTTLLRTGATPSGVVLVQRSRRWRRRAERRSISTRKAQPWDARVPEGALALAQGSSGEPEGRKLP